MAEIIGRIEPIRQIKQFSPIRPINAPVASAADPHYHALTGSG